MIVDTTIWEKSRPTLRSARMTLHQLHVQGWDVMEWRVSPAGAEILRRQVLKREVPRFGEMSGFAGTLLGAPLKIDTALPLREMRAVIEVHTANA